jgi:hypothetical protein
MNTLSVVGVTISAIGIILSPIIISAIVSRFKTTPADEHEYVSPAGNDLKFEIEVSKFLTNRGLSLESIAQHLQKLSSLQGAVKLVISEAIQSLPLDTNLEEELSNLLLCGSCYPDDFNDGKWYFKAGVLHHIPFCRQYLATIRPLKETEKRDICNLIQSFIDQTNKGIVDHSREDLITLLQTLSPDRIVQAKNPEEEKPIVSFPSIEDNPVTKVRPQFELEMRRG